jgi:pilus assembly protein CpaE
MEAASFDVAVVEPDPSLRTRLAVELAGAAQFETMEDLVQRLDPTRPVVAVFGPGFASPIGFQHVHRVTSTHASLGVVFAVYELSTDVLQQALRAGARDAVVIGGEASLHQSVDRVGELLSGTATRAQAPVTRTGAPGRLITVFSTKGGVGKTCVAINVAAAMAKRSTEPVVLVDGDLQFGDVSVMLGLPPQNTVLDAAAAVQYGDMELVQTLATKDAATGMLVLPAPLEPMPTDALMPGEMVNICAALQSIAGHVIVDLPSLFNDYVLALIEASDEILLVGSMDIPSIKNLKIGMQTLDLQAIAGPKLKLVLNHANAKVKLDVKEIERVLGLSANFPVPDDIAVPMSVNAGRPVVVEEPKSPVSRAIECIAESLLGPAATPKKGRRGR